MEGKDNIIDRGVTTCYNGKGGEKSWVQLSIIDW